MAIHSFDIVSYLGTAKTKMEVTTMIQSKITLVVRAWCFLLRSLESKDKIENGDHYSFLGNLAVS